jgi:general transcription factor 3C polypeptide 3 (transcription factor C subunit 4)
MTTHTLAACALISNDEERCISVAREFMRDSSSMSDPARMFALLCRLCQSSTSWYTSGPTQKYILRQIRAIDATHLGNGGFSGEADSRLDVCLLMLYGHILFTSSSYTFALSRLSLNHTSFPASLIPTRCAVFLDYFLRALALDSTNPMISFSVGLGYIHYALKRQSGNRQYLITQGLSFIFRYFHVNASSADITERQAAYFDVARTFQLIGLQDIASRYYDMSLEISPPPYIARNWGPIDLAAHTAFNQWCTLVASGNLVASSKVLRASLTL